MTGTDNRTILRLAFWGIPLSLGVMGLKMLAWWVTGSVALLSDGLESSVNVVAAVIAYAMIGYAAKPADADHPFGHHKAEYFSAVIEGVLIVLAALLIIWEAIPEMMAPVLLNAPTLGLAINFAAGVVNAIWAYVLIRAGSRHRSPALSADGQHILSDVVTSVGVLVGLLLAIATGYAILDPLLAVIVAGNILFQGWKVISRSVDGLMDKAVPADEEEAIKAAIAANAGGSLGVHDLKTRQAGPAIFVDFHMVVPEAMAVGDAHDICDRIEDAIRVVHPGAGIAIHVEPEGEKAHGVRVKVSGASRK
ncbi:cation diffusion facilitator family transporter [Sinorhizobium meliloti]|uniref:cation diffusion facilitator family transporter n=1 Tax=Rhizobium meliloti TaxID=382 RepID=UPI00041D4000|nr:cation diffusion facilitator family transporter [Sinorhizobium meliloti]MDW9359258.1 cation diffusion facilitator family transporter [Sinorhizobium meliloti]MDW9592284.1 cation diffusion facilitator family transporter [Sinorhizobium meliloti]MDW9658442.1 cation diffusion facilitator family transporter [Sinorhizobium meliloti]MDW9918395.1 cation diffusion facilitator family transporter [Sinorhizobium meliloti]MDW9943231.1 cation diffusion facilitator family transporter [Sinorhizobium melilot